MSGGSGTFSNPPKRVVVPAGGENSGDPYIVIAGDSNQSGADFAAIDFFTPTLPTGWRYRMRIRQDVAPFSAMFDIVLMDENDAVVDFVLFSNFREADDAMLQGFGTANLTHTGFSDTLLRAVGQIFCETVDPGDDGSFVVATNTITFSAPVLAGDLRSIRLGTLVNADPTILLKNDRAMGFNVMGSTMLTPPNATTTSTSFANITGANSFTFIKEHADTDVLAHCTQPGFAAGGAGGRIEYGVNFGGAVGHKAVGRLLMSSLNHEPYGSAHTILTDIPAGTYTITPSWRRESGTSTMTINTGCGSLNTTLQEIIQPPL